jgi:hypothetical protein
VCLFSIADTFLKQLGPAGDNFVCIHFRLCVRRLCYVVFVVRRGRRCGTFPEEGRTSRPAHSYRAMYIPGPVFALVLAYVTDGEPARRVLGRTEAALGRTEDRNWRETRRLMETVVYQLCREKKEEEDKDWGPIQMVFLTGEIRVEDCVYCLLAGTHDPALPTDLTTAASSYERISWLDKHNHVVAYCDVIWCDDYYFFRNEDSPPYNNVLFVGGELMMDRDDMRSEHNAYNIFVV